MASVEMRLTQHPRGLRGVSARLIRPGAALAKLSIVLYKALGEQGVKLKGNLSYA